jgi:hypothetical protein
MRFVNSPAGNTSQETTMKFVKIVTIEAEELYVNMDCVVTIYRDPSGHIALSMNDGRRSIILDSEDLEAVILDFNSPIEPVGPLD